MWFKPKPKLKYVPWGYIQRDVEYIQVQILKNNSLRFIQVRVEDINYLSISCSTFQDANSKVQPITKNNNHLIYENFIVKTEYETCVAFMILV